MTAGRGWIASALAAAFVAAGLATWPATPASASVPAQFHGVSVQRHITDEEIARLDQANVGVVRFLLSWQETEPAPGVFDWSSADAYLREIGPTGARALPFFGNVPTWLQTDSSGDPMSTPEARDAWREFLNALVDRYGPDGAFVAVVPEAARVRTWQIWNEPNLDGPWGATADPASYARMVTIASDVIRGRDPGAEIMLAGLAPARHSIRPWDFMRGLLDGLDPATFDTAAIHPYAEDQAGVNSQIDRLRKAMVAGGAGEKPLAVTEFGWSSSRQATESVAGTPRTQARHVKNAYRTFARRKDWQVSEALWFSLHDIPTASPGCGFCTTSGLLRQSGEPKPAWKAFKRSIRKLEDPGQYSAVPLAG